MIDPYTMERLNAEHLKDLDREAAGLHFSAFARHNRRRILRGIWQRCVDLYDTAAERIALPSSRCTRPAAKSAREDRRFNVGR